MSQIRWMGYLLTAVLAVGLVVSDTWKPRTPPKFVGISTNQVPRHVAGYACPADYELDASVQQALASGDTISRLYRKGEDSIDFVLIGGTDREALHDPRSCLVGAGWQLVGDHTERIPNTDIAMRSCHGVGLPQSPSFDMLYLYVVDGKLVTEVTQIRAQMLLSAVIGKRNTPVYFLRFMHNLPDGVPDQLVEHQRLQRFAASMWNDMKSKLNYRSA